MKKFGLSLFILTGFFILLGCAGKDTAKESTQQEIKEDIKAQLYWDTRVRGSDIMVEVTRGGIVTLSGTVPTFEAKQAAEKDAWVVPGVREVNNLLSVRYPSESVVPKDAEIQANIKNMLIWDSSLEAADIEVNVENGITTLKGNVDAFWKKAEAANIASSVTGVLGVKNLLVVVPNEDVVDEVIAKDIISALRRSGKVNPENLNIKVKNGKVTLSGTVPSRKAFEAAYEAALYTTGVVEVDNNLVIQ